jgi:uncharacterized protein DUF2510
MVLARVFIGTGPFLFLALIQVALPIWALIDVTSRPDWAWQASGQSKTTWIVLNVIGLLFCGVVIGLIYLVGIRPKVAMAQHGGSGAGGTYGGYGASTSGTTGYGSGYGGSGTGYGGPAGSGYGWTPPPSAPPPSGAPSPESAPPAAPPPAGGVPAGWYPDPAGGGGLRYWNGTTWTEDVRPG